MSVGAGDRRNPPTSARRRSRCRCRARTMWDFFRRVGFGAAPRARLSGRGRRPAARCEDLAADRAGDHGLRPRHLGQPAAARARLHRVRARRGTGAADAGQNRHGRRAASRCCRAETARAVRAMLEAGGAARRHRRRARASWAGGSAGKTGTAHKQENGGYAADKYVSSFVGFAPVSAPRLVIAVMIDEPSAGQHYGGAVAAPGVLAGHAGRAAPARRAARRAARRSSCRARSTKRRRALEVKCAWTRSAARAPRAR